MDEERTTFRAVGSPPRSRECGIWRTTMAFLASCSVCLAAAILCARLLVSAIASKPPLGSTGTAVAFVALVVAFLLSACAAIVFAFRAVETAMRRHDR